MKRIPLHSLVILVGPANSGKSTLAKNEFSEFEIINSEKVRYELVGDIHRMDINDVVFREIYRRVALKLDMGERVVVDASNLHRGDRMGLAEIGVRMGVPVFYLVCNKDLQVKLKQKSWRNDPAPVITRQDSSFKINERDIVRGDGIAYVIDTRVEDFEIVEKIPGNNLLHDIKQRGYRGIMVVGDVHGMLEPLKNATEWATSRNLFCVFLGDIIDYGANSIECVNHVYDIVTRGRGISIIGNHERKIEKWIEQVKNNDVRVRLSEGNKVTTRAIMDLPNEAKRKFEIRYRALMGFSRHHWIIGNTLFTHGAADPAMFNSTAARLHGPLETLALFGEVDNSLPPRNDGYPNRVYNWVDRIPAGKRVMVGHDIRSTLKPLQVKGALGGEAYFMDTGSGKGGRLTSADIIFDDDNLLIKNFKYH